LASQPTRIDKKWQTVGWQPATVDDQTLETAFFAVKHERKASAKAKASENKNCPASGRPHNFLPRKLWWA
jgi:hypothetical protein